MTEADCNMCHKQIEIDDIKVIAGRVLCEQCYFVVLKRLKGFMDLLTLPENEFNEWLEDDSQ